MQTAASPCTRDIDCSSLKRYRSFLARTPKAYTRSGQSERHVPPTPIRTRELSSILKVHTLLLLSLFRQRAQLLKKSALGLCIIREKAPPTVHYSSRFSCAIRRRCCPQWTQLVPFWSIELLHEPRTASSLAAGGTLLPSPE